MVPVTLLQATQTNLPVELSIRISKSVDPRRCSFSAITNAKVTSGTFVGEYFSSPITTSTELTNCHFVMGALFVSEATPFGFVDPSSLWNGVGLRDGLVCRLVV